MQAQQHAGVWKGAGLQLGSSACALPAAGSGDEQAQLQSSSGCSERHARKFWRILQQGFLH
jgi:hypothetical protein